MARRLHTAPLHPFDRPITPGNVGAYLSISYSPRGPGGVGGLGALASADWKAVSRHQVTLPGGVHGGHQPARRRQCPAVERLTNRGVQFLVASIPGTSSEVVSIRPGIPPQMLC
jgi:hypothetical protein